MLDIISVGPGEAVLLTDDAKQAIDRADAVWCAARHAVFVPPEKARPLSPLEGAIEQMRLSSDAGQSAAVLVSGDAGLYSLLEMLKRKIGGDFCVCIRASAPCSSLPRGWAFRGRTRKSSPRMAEHFQKARCATPCGRIGRRFAFSTRRTILRGCGRA